ncbi:MAG: PLP-dependent aminotransferase family protein [Actinomycetota bacterium]|nr:PLP-dependent aminotransferase family protein [Actinomycetota bacterium]
MKIFPTELVRMLGPWRNTSSTLPASLAVGLSALILDGRLPVGIQLPAERVLAEALGVSRASVVAALDELRARQCLRTTHGAGSTVCLPPHTELASLSAWAAATSTSPAEPAMIDWSAATPTNPPVAVLDAYQQALTRLPFAGTGYSAGGLVELRVAVADRYTRRGLRTDPDQILVTAGAQQALSLLVEHKVRPRDRVLVETPTYPGMLDVLRAARARLSCVPVEGGWSLTSLRAGLGDPANRLAYLMPGLHNPTGQVMSRSQQESVLHSIASPGPAVILDETLADLHPPDRPGPLETPDASHLLRIGSMSKTVWGGLRVGWVRSDRATAQLLAQARTRNDLGTPVLEQLAAAAIFDDYDNIVAARRSHLRKAAAQLTDALGRRIPSLSVSTPSVSPYLWCRLPSAVNSRVFMAAARQHRLRLIDPAYFNPHGARPDHVRLPLDVAPHNVPEAVDRLAMALEASRKNRAALTASR